VIWVTAAFPFDLIPEDRSVSEAEMAESLPSQGQLGLDTRAGRREVARRGQTGHAGADDHHLGRSGHDQCSLTRAVARENV